MCRPRHHFFSFAVEANMASQRRSSRRSGSLLNRAVEALEVRRLLVFTGSVSGTTAIFTGDSAGDTLTIDQSGGLLRHNRAGDPGFNSAFDFDSSVAGDQTLAANSATTLTANCGDGNDNINIGTAAVPASQVAGRFAINGEGDSDTVVWENSSDATGRTVNVDGGIFNQVFIPFTGASVGFGTTNETVSVLSGMGADTINVTG